MGVLPHGGFQKHLVSHLANKKSHPGIHLSGFLPRNLRNAIGRWGAALILVGKGHNTTSLKGRQYGTGRNWASFHPFSHFGPRRAANRTETGGSALIRDHPARHRAATEGRPYKLGHHQNGLLTGHWVDRMLN